MKAVCNVLDVGLKDYMEVYDLQKKLLAERIKNKIPDTLILTEHSPTFTIGRKGGRENILVSNEVLGKNGIKVYEVDRGGDITYHGPGQIVGYPIMNLAEWNKDIHFYLRSLEEAIIRFLSHFKIMAVRMNNYTGVWVGDCKIAAIGIGVSKWTTFHGFCININPNKKHFGMITPCGITDKKVTSLDELTGETTDMGKAKQVLVNEFGNCFRREMRYA
ncbi:lipoyl(octanoyl) transferase LipB [bacterium]|nr:lipoyl(octanoyl) transferase LipB [bacterium]